jgi:putative oxidoreductase
VQRAEKEGRDMRTFRAVAAWCLQVLLAAVFVMQAVMKLGGSAAWIARFRAWGYPEHFYLIVGATELAGAVALLVPRMATYGAALLMLVMVGAAATHAAHGERQVMTNVVLILLLALVLYLRRREQRPLQASV